MFYYGIISGLRSMYNNDNKCKNNFSNLDTNSKPNYSVGLDGLLVYKSNQSLIKLLFMQTI